MNAIAVTRHDDEGRHLMIIALFAFRVRPEVGEEFHAEVTRMAALVARVPGFLSMDLFHSEDGRTLAIPRFESTEALDTWRNHPDHLAAKARGSEFFDDYSIDICQAVSSSAFHRTERPQ